MRARDQIDNFLNLTHKNIPDGQKCDHFQKTVKVLDHSTLLSTVVRCNANYYK